MEDKFMFLGIIIFLLGLGFLLIKFSSTEEEWFSKNHHPMEDCEVLIYDYDEKKYLKGFYRNNAFRLCDKNLFLPKNFKWRKLEA
ncbi:MAG: hypothetical protein ACEQSX_14690 [Baekduiaceae bacterium]